MAEIYRNDVERFILYFSDDKDEKELEIWDYYDNLMLSTKITLYNTHMALMACKNYEEIAEDFTKREQKKKPLTKDAIRKRSEKVLTIIKEGILNKYGKK